MPTPMRWYAEAARLYGGVDPTDKEAVDQFFLEAFKRMDGLTQGEVLAYLLLKEGRS